MDMVSFFQTLLRPDHEEDPKRSEVARAANLLQIGEFQLLQLAYKEWHGHDLLAETSDAVFRAYMLRGEAPPWARHYARRIIVKDELGDLNDRDPSYHRFDCDYYKALPLGAQRLALAVMCLAFVVCGGILVGYYSSVSATSIVPPFFNEDEIEPGAGATVPRVTDLRGS